MSKNFPMDKIFPIKSVITLDDLIDQFEKRAVEATRPYNEYWAGVLQYDVAVLNLCKKLKEEGYKCESLSAKV